MSIDFRAEGQCEHGKFKLRYPWARQVGLQSTGLAGVRCGFSPFNPCGRLPMIAALREGWARAAPIGIPVPRACRLPCPVPRDSAPHCGVRLEAMMRAAGLSRPYCAMIRRGERVPHARHWAAIAAALAKQLE